MLNNRHRNPLWCWSPRCSRTYTLAGMFVNAHRSYDFVADLNESAALYSAPIYVRPLGAGVHKHYGSNYSLWPEQARPRRAIPLTLKVGGFAIGIVCCGLQCRERFSPLCFDPRGARENWGCSALCDGSCLGHWCQPHPVLAGGRESHTILRLIEVSDRKSLNFPVWRIPMFA